MSFRIGATYAGLVDTINGQGILTEYFTLGIPLVPLSSMFVVEQLATGNKGFKIRLYFKSLLVGYTQWLAGILCIVMLVLFIAGGRNMGFAYIGLGALVAIGATLVVGKVGRTAKRERTLLGAATGIYGYPWWLPHDVALDMYANLQLLWKNEGYGYEWKQALVDSIAHKDHLHLVYALGTYAAHCEPEHRKEYTEQVQKLLKKYYM